MARPRKHAAGGPESPPGRPVKRAKMVGGKSNSDDQKTADNPAVDGSTTVPKSPVPTAEEKKGSATQNTAQIPKGKTPVIKPDEGFINRPGYQVHVDQDSEVIYDAALNQAHSSVNSNKFYRIQLLIDRNENCVVWTRWGRVGERGASKSMEGLTLMAAMPIFEKKFKDKTGLAWKNRDAAPKPGKYVFVERNYDSDSDEPAEPSPVKKGAQEHGPVSPAPCTLDPPIKSLMELLFNPEFIAGTMSDLGYDATKLPLGKLSQGTIGRGYQVLKDLWALLDDPSLASSQHQLPVAKATERLSDLYYSYIPHIFGRSRPPVIGNYLLLKREVELMDSLTGLKDADNITKPDVDGGQPIHHLELCYRRLGLETMTLVDNGSQEFHELGQYLVKTRGETHAVRYQIRDIFRVERCGECERFEGSRAARQGDADGDRRLLWHGSRVSNFGSILSQGLRIAPPEAPANGYMFGKGIYLADMSSKSANYCCARLSGGEALLLLCEVELGGPMLQLLNHDGNAGELARGKGMASVQGKGAIAPHAWKDAGCVHPALQGVTMPDVEAGPPGPSEEKLAGASRELLYNEYVAYDVSQVRLRYLLRVRM